MPLPELPLELWLDIIERACLVDMRASLALSQASRELREISRFHRYRTVKIKGHEQLLAFESQFSNAPEEVRSISHLLVQLPPLHEIAYADEQRCASPSARSDAESTDSSYAPSSTDASGDDDQYLASDTQSDSEDSCFDEEDELEYGDITVDEVCELREEASNLPPLLYRVRTLDGFRIPDGITCWIDPLCPDSSYHDVSRLDHLSSYHTQITDLEFKVYSALRRILEGSSSSLRLFALDWEPHSDLNAEALFPVLPKLQSLAIFDRWPTSHYVVHDILHQDFTPSLTLFPSLRRLDINTVRRLHWPGTLLKAVKSISSLQSLTLPCKLIQASLGFDLFPLSKSVQTMRCNCQCSGLGSTRPRCYLDVTELPTSVEWKQEYFFSKSDLENEWEEQRC